MNATSDGSKVLYDASPVPPREAVQRWRLVLARDAIPPAAVGREQQSAWETAFAECALPVAGLDAPKPRPRYSQAAPLGAGIPGEAELLDLWLTERLPAWRVREVLEASMPARWRLVDLYDVWLGEAALPGRVAASVYRATFAPGSVSVDALREAAAALLGRTSLPRERRKGEAVVAYDLRPFIDGVVVAGGSADGGPIVTMTLRHDPEKGVGRPDELLAALGERAALVLVPSSLVRERLVLGDPPPPPPPAPRRRPAARPLRVGRQRL